MRDGRSARAPDYAARRGEDSVGDATRAKVAYFHMPTAGREWQRDFIGHRRMNADFSSPEGMERLHCGRHTGKQARILPVSLLAAVKGIRWTRPLKHSA